MMTAFLILAWAMVLAWFGLLGLIVTGSVYAWLYMRADHGARPPEPLPSEQPGITVLRPLKGIDYALRENLESTFQLQYPRFELLFNVASADDPAVAVVHELQAKYPQVQATLTVGEVIVGHNPKINNLVLSYEKGQYEWAIIIDSNARVEPHFLTHLAGMLREDIGCFSTPFIGMEAQGVGGWLERIFLNTFNTRWMVTCQMIDRAFVVGKAMMVRKKAVDQFGGLRHLGAFLAEDMVTGIEMKKQGLKVWVPNVTVSQMLGRQGIKSFWMRHVRWARIRKSQVGHVFLIEPLISSFPTGFLGAAAFSFVSGAPFWLGLAFHWLVWGAADFALMKKLDRRSGFVDVIVWLFHEVMTQAIWIWALSSNKVSWRGTTLTLMPGGRVLSKEILEQTREELEEEKQDQSLTVW